jgi:tetratricopeptide (TPR) repeat protein
VPACPDDSDLQLFVSGAASDSSLVSLGDHLATCAACRAAVAAVRTPQDSGAHPDHAAAEPGAGGALDRYVFVGVLGSGAGGLVYRAYDPKLQREIALKRVRSETTDVERLLAESRAMARLAHPNVVSVYDAEVVDDGVFIAMEYVPGQTLARWLAEDRRGWREISAVFQDAGAALAAAHDAGIVHRDFKPSNVLVGTDGRVRVTDFGLACAWDPELAASSSDHAGGTPLYMAPEQFAGAAADPRTDQYSFCVALYEALCGERPFAARDVRSLRSQKQAGPPAVLAPTQRVSARVRRAVLRGLSPSPADRWPSMRRLLGELRPRSRLTGPGLVAGAAALVVAAAVGHGWIVHRPASTLALCEDTQRSFDTTWSRDTLPALTARFGRVDDERARRDWPRIASTLSAYAADWQRFHDEVCGRDDMDRTRASERLLCLERRRNGFHAMLESLADPDRSALPRALDPGLHLPDVGTCSAEADRALSAPGPTDEATFQRLRNRLARAEAIQIAGETDAAIAAIREVVEASRELGHDPFVALGLLALGRAQRTHDVEAAERSLRDAFHVALRAGDGAVAAESAIAIAELAPWLREPGHPEDWLGHARALVERGGIPRSVEATLLRAEATRSNQLGDFDEAADRYERALAILEEIGGETAPELGDVYLGLAALPGERETASDATSLHRARAIYAASYGDDHWLVGVAELAIGAYLNRTGDADESREALARAGRIFDRWYDPAHPAFIEALALRATLHVLDGRRDEAATLTLRAVDIADRIYAADDPRLFAPLNNHVTVLLGRRDHRQALRYSERALAVARHLDRGYALAGHAKALHRNGQLSAAIEHYRQALQQAKQTSDRRLASLMAKELGRLLLVRRDFTGARDHYERELPAADSDEDGAALRFGLARAYWGEGSRSRAIAVAQQALGSLSAAPTGTGADLADEIRQWMTPRRQ